MKDSKVFFTIDVPKLLREAGYPEDAKYAEKLVFRIVESPKQVSRSTPAAPPPQPSIFVDEDGRLRFN